MSVYTRAGHRSHRCREIPAIGQRHTEREADHGGADGQDQRVRQAGLEQVGMACWYSSQFTNESFSCDSVDFGAAAADPLAGGLGAIAAKSGSCWRRRRLGARFPSRRQRARHPIGVQPRPSAVGDDRRRVRCSARRCSGLFSSATAHATKLSKLKVFSMISRRITRLHRCPTPAATAPPMRRFGRF